MGRVGVDEVAFDGAALDEEMGESVEEREVALGAEGNVERGGDGGLGAARIEDNDLGGAAVGHHALPHDGVGDARVGTDEDEGVAFLEVGVGEGRGVEAEGLFVGDVRGSHALACVGIDVEHAHAEFREGAEEGHFLHDDLAGGEEGERVGAVGLLDGAETGDEGRERDFPGDGFEQAGGLVAEERRGEAVGGGERGEGFPALGAGHAEVDGVGGIGAEVDGVSGGVAVDVERAAGAAETADGLGGGGGGEAGRVLGDAEAEVGGATHELRGHRAGAGAKLEERRERSERGFGHGGRNLINREGR